MVRGASGLVWAEWGPPTLIRYPRRFTAFLILIVRKIRLNPLWVRYTKIVRKRCGLVPPQHSTASTAAAGATATTAWRPDLQTVPMLSRLAKTAQAVCGLAHMATDCFISTGERDNSIRTGTIRRIHIV